MTEAVLDREDRGIIIYDDCRMPLGQAFRHRELAQNKDLIRLLKAWRVSDKPSRKKRRVPLRKVRRIYCGYNYQHGHTQAEASFIVSLIAATKAVNKRSALEVELRSVFDRLAALKKIQDVDDEYTLKPTPRAFINTKLTIMNAYVRMGERFPMPRIVPDGEGGIVAGWLRDSKRVRLRFRANREQRDYVYYQSADDYDVENVTTENLTKRLDWLLSA